MKEQIHKYKDDYVLLRFDENELDFRANNKSEYRTWKEWKSWFKNAKLYRNEDDAREALVMSRLLSKK